MMNLFAQATGAPNTGASNAEDFQPLTRNPQTTGGGLQPGTVPQNTSGQDILNKENTRIIIPVSDDAPQTQGTATTPDPGINWLPVLIATVLIVAALYYLLERRDRRRKERQTPVDNSPQEVITVPADEPVAEAATPAETEEQPKAKPAPKKSTSTKKKTKSKSKRKKSRK